MYETSICRNKSHVKSLCENKLHINPLLFVIPFVKASHTLDPKSVLLSMIGKLSQET